MTLSILVGKAYYLCDFGAQKDIRKAIFAYNHADWCVNDVLAQAKKYGDAMVGTGDCKNIQAPNAATAMAINFACGQLGLPCVWGGNGAKLTELRNGQTQVTGGFDCSGLTKASYAAGGIDIPRTAHTQYLATTRVGEAELLPGDLVFYGNPIIKIHHVGLYLGGGLMIDAPTFGKPVGVHPVRYRGDDFAGGGRFVW
jgi:cell wall-associated NlpC family hydrolase